MRNAGLEETEAGIKIAGRNSNNLRYADDTTIMAESKEEKEGYKHLNAEFQRIARRDKKAFFSDQCKEMENNRMGKTRDHFKKSSNTKEHFMQ